jgi:hypothetical protein
MGRLSLCSGSSTRCFLRDFGLVVTEIVVLRAFLESLKLVDIPFGDICKKVVFTCGK